MPSLPFCGPAARLQETDSSTVRTTWDRTNKEGHLGGGLKGSWNMWSQISLTTGIYMHKHFYFGLGAILRETNPTKYTHATMGPSVMLAALRNCLLGASMAKLKVFLAWHKNR